MSIDSARIVCTGCDYETQEFYRPIRIRYQTTSGKSVETGRAKGWCYDCPSYSDIERINKSELCKSLKLKEQERLEALHRQSELNSGFLSNIRHKSEKTKLQYQLGFMDEEILELGILLEIANVRKSKARCLACSSERTALIAFDSVSNIAHDFQHDCGGNLKIIRDKSSGRFNFRVSTYVLNEEGEFLGEE